MPFKGNKTNKIHWIFAVAAIYYTFDAETIFGYLLQQQYLARIG